MASMSADKRDNEQSHPTVAVRTPEEANLKAAEILTDGAFNAVLLRDYGNMESMPELSVLYAHLLENAKALTATDGDRIQRAESMLLGQATALQTMFIDLALRAKAQKNREWLQTFTSLALRAQSNCTQTLRVLAELRSPRQPVFAKQANIANGPQQVNNRETFSDTKRTRARESRKRQNELLETRHGLDMDTRATRAPSAADQAVAAMGKVDRTSE